ncbi:MAG TPA: DUF4190 domain-containing protein [Verrucomicrobiae bacterium]|nr:DUF4190 domain-containing protein [Verrucomicrobiae bacterium]
MNETTGSPSAPRTSGLAIWSLVLGILSLVCFTIFSAIPGVICGHKALSQIKRSGDAITGQGLAIGGLVTGYIGMAMALFMIPMFLAIAIPNFMKAREVAMRNACINNLREIDAAKQKWAVEKQKQTTDIPTENDLAPYLPHGMPKCPAQGDYKINAVGVSPTCTVANHQLER